MKRDDETISGNMPDEYDRALAGLSESQQAVTSTRPALVRAIPMFGIGGATSFNVTTFRQAGQIIEEDVNTGVVKRGPATFTVAMEVAKGERLQRIIVPDKVLALLISQRESLTSQAQRKAGQAAAKTRKERGIVSTFGGRRGRKGKK